MLDRALVIEAKDPGKEPCRLFLVAGRDDRVVEDDGQERLLLKSLLEMSLIAAIDKHQRLQRTLSGRSGSGPGEERLHKVQPQSLIPRSRQE